MFTATTIDRVYGYSTKLNETKYKSKRTCIIVILVHILIFLENYK